MVFRIFQIKIAIALALFAIQNPTTAIAQHDHSHTAFEPSMVQEPGQGAFAAISEIVTLLGQDPNTDWNKVNIAALRQHLVDMSDLMLRSKAKEVQIAGGLRMTIDLENPENAAAGRMVPAHAPVLAAETGWLSAVSHQGTTIIWEVTAPSAVKRIKALGFYGLMATGDHHKAHHIALARGKNIH